MLVTGNVAVQISKTALQTIACEWAACEAQLNSWTSYQKHLLRHCHDFATHINVPKLKKGYCYLKRCNYRKQSTVRSLMEHINTSHLSRAQLPCPHKNCDEHFLASRLEALEAHVETRHPDVSGLALNDVRHILRRTLVPPRGPTIDAPSCARSSSSLAQRSRSIGDVRFNPYTPCVQPGKRRPHARNTTQRLHSDSPAAATTRTNALNGRILQRHSSQLLSQHSVVGSSSTLVPAPSDVTKDTSSKDKSNENESDCGGCTFSNIYTNSDVSKNLMDGGVKMIPEPCFQELLPTPPTTQFYRPVTDHGIFPDLKTRYASDCIGWPAFTERYADLLQVDEDLSSYIRSGR